jgi:hypothetical protein
MANEFVHAAAGSELTEGEFHSVLRHTFNDQARGDMAISNTGGTGLIRLALGTTGYPLLAGSSDPRWGGINLVVDQQLVLGSASVVASTAGGLLRHEAGGLELNISSIGVGDVIAGVSSGAVEIVDGGSASDGDVLTIQADGTANWETPAAGGGMQVSNTLGTQVIPNSSAAPQVDSGTSANGYGNYSQLIASTSGAMWIIGALVRVDVQLENGVIEIATGSATSEVRQAEKMLPQTGTTTAMRVEFAVPVLIASGQRLAIRVKDNSSSARSWYTHLEYVLLSDLESSP